MTFAPQVPSIGAYIVRENQKVRTKLSDSLHLPLAGVAIGDGWVDPVRQIDAYPEMMFGQGMISSAQKMTIRQYCDEAIEAIEQGDMVGALRSTASQSCRPSSSRLSASRSSGFVQ